MCCFYLVDGTPQVTLSHCRCNTGNAMVNIVLTSILVQLQSVALEQATADNNSYYSAVGWLCFVAT